MVESDGVARALEGDQRAGDAAQALTAILQTQYLRYMIITSWAVGLLGTVGLWPALLWFGGTLAAGSLRGLVEHRLSHRVGTNWGVIFPIVATVTTGGEHCWSSISRRCKSCSGILKHTNRIWLSRSTAFYLRDDDVSVLACTWARAGGLNGSSWM